ncbi:TlpA disulfide reductase family protein [Ideonella sp. A 288]|uniref:TlpA disulfide reductase family protein n=1 Tax=Ideonella sp. A 288 TaxID=1962181 RepID=UPI000B4B81EA|nr:TlpA disulfide reductase family protein [Ideonella sp. A 288]
MTARRSILFGSTAALAAAAGGGLGWWHATDADAATAQDLPPQFWSQRFARPEGGEVALADFRRQPLLINFWATWCPPCVRELPAIDRLAREQAASGLKVLALAIDGPTPVREFLQRTPLKVPVGLAGMDGIELTRQLGNTKGGLPFTVLVSADGRVTHRKVGETSLEELNGWLKPSKR